MSWTHLEDTKPIGRKDYLCFLCGRAIEKGVRHVQRKGVDEDGFDSFRMHAACEAKTHDWREWEWECHDADEFRECELEEST